VAREHLDRLRTLARVRPDLISRLSDGTMSLEAAESVAGLWCVTQMADDGPTAWQVARTNSAGEEYAGNYPTREAAVARARTLNLTRPPGVS